ncbi:MAG: CRTAC1 family protein [Planctomycetes bacterium]|nr:CRTAC1 family protein [Planctomycetota bacterium]
MLALALIFTWSALPQAQAETPTEEFLRIGKELYANENPFIGAGPRRNLEQALADPVLPVEKRVELQVQLSQEYLKGAEVERAIELLETTLELAQGSAGGELQRHLGLAYLRQAEQENCVKRHNAECCIFPLQGGAVHQERAPAQKAREQYLALLAANPEDREALWLLNITAMALGEYPASVPERWRLPEKSFASETEFPRFHDVASKVGLDVMNMAGGVAVEDFDGDGWLDVLFSTCDPLGPLRFLHNGGDGTFSDRSQAAGITGQLGGLNLVAGDYDNDGDFDVVVLRGAWLFDYGCIRKSLLRNDGGVFTDVTRAAGMSEPAFPTQTGTFGDFDGDGWLDFYVGHESRAEFSKAVQYPSQLYRNKGDGAFENATQRAGVANDRYAKGVAAGDYDNDGDLDLFVSNIGLNRLYRNKGDGTFRDVGAKAGVTGVIGADGKAERHFASWFFDYDNDGWLDLWNAGFGATLTDLANAALGQPDKAVRPMLLHNQRDGTFVDRAAEMGVSRAFLPMGSNFGDLDNDGWLDIYLGTGEPALQVLMPNVLLVNRRGERFLDVTSAAGMGHLQKGHGVAFADLDQDGDQDVVHQLGGFFLVDRFQSALFENPGFGNHWLSLELVGTKSNRMAVGARVRVVLETPTGSREIHRAAGSVSSFGGSPHRLEIGLADATKVQRLEIRWPRTSEPQVFTDVALDSFVRATEGRAELERLERKSVRF